MKIITAGKRQNIKWQENTGAVNIVGDLAASGTCAVTGATTLTGAVACSSTLAVTGATTQTGAITCASTIAKTGANGQAITIKQATVSKTCSSGTGTETCTGLIPAGALVLAVDARVTTILAGTSLTTWSLGITSHTDHFGTGLAKAAGTTVGIAAYKVADIPGPFYAVAATDVLLTAAAGQFDSGVVRITIHYIELTPATS